MSPKFLKTKLKSSRCSSSPFFSFFFEKETGHKLFCKKSTVVSCINWYTEISRHRWARWLAACSRNPLLATPSGGKHTFSCFVQWVTIFSIYVILVIMTINITMVTGLNGTITFISGQSSSKRGRNWRYDRIFRGWTT